MPALNTLPPPVRVMGVQVHPYSVGQLHHHLAALVARGDATVMSANAHALRLAQQDMAFRATLNRADIVICDGVGVVLAGRAYGVRLPERITYADWTPQLAAFAAARGYSMYLLGGKPGVAERAAARLCSQFPGLRITGTQHGYFDRARDSAAVVEQVNAAAPDLLLVGMGMPIQEAWITAHRAALNARVVLACGAAMDYASGDLRRAPRWMTGNGLEWFGRLLIEPRRLWRRYTVGHARLMYYILRDLRRRQR